MIRCASDEFDPLGPSIDDDGDSARAGRGMGMDVREDHGMLSLSIGGGKTVLVYSKDDHVPAMYTTLNIPLDDIDAACGTPDDGRGTSRRPQGDFVRRYPDCP